jgi:hypothetical protein
MLTDQNTHIASWDSDRHSDSSGRLARVALAGRRLMVILGRAETRTSPTAHCRGSPGRLQASQNGHLARDGQAPAQRRSASASGITGRRSSLNTGLKPRSTSPAEAGWNWVLSDPPQPPVGNRWLTGRRLKPTDFGLSISFTHEAGGLSIYSVTACGVSFQLANAAYVQFAVLLPLLISQAGSLRHD